MDAESRLSAQANYSLPNNKQTVKTSNHRLNQDIFLNKLLGTFVLFNKKFLFRAQVKNKIFLVWDKGKFFGRHDMAKRNH